MIGRGGMGVVLKAFDPALNRVVAIKVLAPQLAASGAARRRFAREAKAAAAVVHDHVVAIHAVGRGPARACPTWSCSTSPAGRSRSGSTATARSARGDPPDRHADGLGLAAAHAQGLVHRDIKPANILLENGVERVKITDFGLARAVDDASLTQSGVVAGTPQYMSPEQASGEAVDHRADLFSLGSVLYAMCTGQLAVPRQDDHGRPPTRLRRRAPAGPRDQPRGPRVARGRDRAGCTPRTPPARYQSAAEVAELLGRQLAELQRPGPRPSRTAPVPRRRRPPRPQRPARPRSPPALPRTGRSPGPSRGPAGRAHAIALLGLFGLVAVAMVLPFAPPFREAGPPWIHVAIGAQAGRGQPPVNMIVNTAQRRAADDRRLGQAGDEGLRPRRLHGGRDRVPVPRRGHPGGSLRGVVTADDNLLEHVLVAKEGTRLKIGLEDNRSYRFRATRSRWRSPCRPWRRST